MADGNKPVITVIGAGAWGTALAMAIARNDNIVNLWSNDATEIANMRADGCNQAYLGDIPLPDNIILHDDFIAATKNINDMLIVVPSHAFSSIIDKLAELPHKKSLRISWGTKGIDPETHELLSEIILEKLPFKPPMAVVAGPTFAKEVALGLPSRLTISSYQREFSEHLMYLISNDTMGCELGDDIKAIQICGCSKNIFAIICGVCDGLKWNDNARAAIFTLCFQEMAKLIRLYNGSDTTILYSAAVGDFFLTCCNDQSRNRQLGLAIGRGENVDSAIQQVGKLVEGYTNTKQLHDYLKSRNICFPVIDVAYSILYKSACPSLELKKLLNITS